MGKTGRFALERDGFLKHYVVTEENTLQRIMWSEVELRIRNTCTSIRNTGNIRAK